MHCLTMDMQALDAVSKTLDQLPDEFEPIDILVNNAGLALGTSTAQELKIEVLPCKRIQACAYTSVPERSVAAHGESAVSKCNVTFLLSACAMHQAESKSRGFLHQHQKENASLCVQDMATMVDTNIKGVMAMTRAIAPSMLERNSGHIINMSSIAGHEAYPNGSVYCATKHAVDAFTKALRHDVVATQVLHTCFRGIITFLLSSTLALSHIVWPSGAMRMLQPVSLFPPFSLLLQFACDGVYACWVAPTMSHFAASLVLGT